MSYQGIIPENLPKSTGPTNRLPKHCPRLQGRRGNPELSEGSNPRRDASDLTGLVRGRTPRLDQARRRQQTEKDEYQDTHVRLAHGLNDARRHLSDEKRIDGV